MDEQTAAALRRLAYAVAVQVGMRIQHVSVADRRGWLVRDRPDERTVLIQWDGEDEPAEMARAGWRVLDVQDARSVEAADDAPDVPGWHVLRPHRPSLTTGIGESMAYVIRQTTKLPPASLGVIPTSAVVDKPWTPIVPPARMDADRETIAPDPLCPRCGSPAVRQDGIRTRSGIPMHRCTNTGCDWAGALWIAWRTLAVRLVMQADDREFAGQVVGLNDSYDFPEDARLATGGFDPIPRPAAEHVTPEMLDVELPSWLDGLSRVRHWIMRTDMEAGHDDPANSWTMYEDAVERDIRTLRRACLFRAYWSDNHDRLYIESFHADGDPADGRRHAPECVCLRCVPDALTFDGDHTQAGP